MDFKRLVPFFVVGAVILLVGSSIALEPMFEDFSELGFKSFGKKRYCCTGGKYNQRCVTKFSCEKRGGTIGAACKSSSQCAIKHCCVDGKYNQRCVKESNCKKGGGSATSRCSSNSQCKSVTTTTVSDEKCPSGGLYYEGECWYRDVANQGCDGACRRHRLVSSHGQMCSCREGHTTTTIRPNKCVSPNRCMELRTCQENYGGCLSGTYSNCGVGACCCRPGGPTTTILNSCEDSDGGIEVGIKGDVTGFFNGSPFLYSDKCHNSDTIEEMSCDGTRFINNTLPCSSFGYTSCSNGVCTTPPQPSSVSKNLLLDTKLNDPSGFESIIDKSILVSRMIDGPINVIENTYNARDYLEFPESGTISVESGLTAASPQEDFKSESFIEVGKSSVRYYFDYKEPLRPEDYLTGASVDNPVIIIFLGRALAITGVSDADTMIIEDGSKYSLNVGDTVTYDTHQVSLVNVGSSGSIIVSVDGVSGTIAEGEQKTINGLQVKNTLWVYSDNLGERMAVVLVGYDISDTINRHDAYCVGVDDKNQCEDDTTWVWDLGGLTGSDPTIGIMYNSRLDEHDEVIRMGQEFSLPHDYIKIRLDDYVEKDYRKYTVEADEIADLYPASGSTGIIDTARTIHIYGDGSSKNSIRIVGTPENSYLTDDIYLYYSDSGYAVDVYYKNPNDNKVRYYMKVSSGLTKTIAYFKYQDTLLPVKLQWNSTKGHLIFDTDNGDDIKIYIQTDAIDRFTYLGHSDGDTLTTGDLFYGRRDISGWEEDTRTKNGIVIYDPESHLTGDHFRFDVNGDESDFRVKVTISKP